MKNQTIAQALEKIEPYASLNMDLLHASETAAAIAIPLDGNHNDKNTMFAGSIYSALVLAGWALARAATLAGLPRSKLVIARSETRYLLPVQSGATAKAVVDSPATRKSENKITIGVAVELLDSQNRPCARFTATYIAIKTPPAGLASVE